VGTHFFKKSDLVINYGVGYVLFQSCRPSLLRFFIIALGPLASGVLLRRVLKISLLLL
jgi:hypothetical protein